MIHSQQGSQGTGGGFATRLDRRLYGFNLSRTRSRLHAFVPSNPPLSGGLKVPLLEAIGDRIDGQKKKIDKGNTSRSHQLEGSRQIFLGSEKRAIEERRVVCESGGLNQQPHSGHLRFSYIHHHHPYHTIPTAIIKFMSQGTSHGYSNTTLHYYVCYVTTERDTSTNIATSRPIQHHISRGQPPNWPKKQFICSNSTTLQLALPNSVVKEDVCEENISINHRSGAAIPAL